MAPLPLGRDWNLPAISTTGELAAWLGVSIPRLEWFADLRDRNGKHDSRTLRHYHYRPLAKRSGNIRLIEAPKERLKEIQRLILVGILEKIPRTMRPTAFCVAARSSRSPPRMFVNAWCCGWI